MAIPANAYGNMKIKATWDGITYNIIYLENGGLDLTNDTYKVQEDQLNLLPSPKYQHDFHLFCCDM